MSMAEQIKLFKSAVAGAMQEGKQELNPLFDAIAEKITESLLADLNSITAERLEGLGAIEDNNAYTQDLYNDLDSIGKEENEEEDFDDSVPHFLINSDGKAELYIGYDEYKKIDAKIQGDIKRFFLFSRSKGAWISKGYYPNWSIDNIVKALNLKFKGKQQKKSFEEKVNQKKEYAENRAERYEAKADKVEKKAESLKSAFNKAAKDWSWLTQPNINTSAGRAFTRQREKIYEQYDRGMALYKKSDYYLNKSVTAQNTAEQKKYKDYYYLINKIKEIDTSIRKRGEWIPRVIAEAEKLENTQENALRIAEIELVLDKYNELFEEKAFLLSKLEEIPNPEFEFEQTDFFESPKPILKAFLKRYFDLEITTFKIDYKSKHGAVYLLRTDKDLPEAIQVGFAAKNVTQVTLKELYAFMEKVKKEALQGLGSISEDNMRLFAELNNASFMYVERGNLGAGNFSSPYGNIYHLKFGWGEGNKFASKFRKEGSIYTIKTAQNGQLVEIHVENKHTEDFEDFVNDYILRNSKNLQYTETLLSDLESISKQKEAWEMTFEEFKKYFFTNDYKIWFNSLSEKDRKSIYENSYTHYGSHYRRILKWALKQGKPVPAEVLAEYPELRK